MSGERSLQLEQLRRRLIAREPAARAQLRHELSRLPLGDRDPYVDQLLGLDPLVSDDPAALPQGCVPYYPCGVDVILRAIEGAAIGADDVFVDIGAGVGRVLALTHLLTGVRALGLEVQPALASRARALAQALAAPELEIVQGDAAELLGSVTSGTVFFLYCPFSGSRLERVLARIAELATNRSVRLCAVHMPAFQRPWLELISQPTEELLIYRSM